MNLKILLFNSILIFNLTASAMDIPEDNNSCHSFESEADLLTKDYTCNLCSEVFNDIPSQISHLKKCWEKLHDLNCDEFSLPAADLANPIVLDSFSNQSEIAMSDEDSETQQEFSVPKKIKFHGALKGVDVLDTIPLFTQKNINYKDSVDKIAARALTTPWCPICFDYLTITNTHTNQQASKILVKHIATKNKCWQTIGTKRIRCELCISKGTTTPYIARCCITNRLKALIGENIYYYKPNKKSEMIERLLMDKNNPKQKEKISLVPKEAEYTIDPSLLKTWQLESSLLKDRAREEEKEADKAKKDNYEIDTSFIRTWQLKPS